MNLPSDESAFKSTRAQLKTATSGNLELVSRPKTDQSAKIHDYLASRSLKRISESQNTKSQSSFRHVDQGED